MSKDKVVEFFNEAAKNEQIKEKLQTVSSKDELAALGKKEGFEFSSEHVDEVISDLKEQPGFFGKVIEAFLEIFSPSHDDYPSVGVQPFTGDPNPNR